jgi:hypothetical protein
VKKHNCYFLKIALRVKEIIGVQHVACTGETKTGCRILVGKSGGKIPISTMVYGIMFSGLVSWIRLSTK